VVSADSSLVQAGTAASGNFHSEGDSLHVRTRVTDDNDGSSTGTERNHFHQHAHALGAPLDRIANPRN
jgi:hypothetical protein